MIAAWLLLDEDPGARGWLGIVLVVGFGVMVGWRNEQAASVAAEVGAGV